MSAKPFTARRPRLHPVAAALAVLLPPLAAWPAGPVLLTPPAPTAVPVPAATWRTYGTGASGPVNLGNTRGGVDQTIAQTSPKAIYNWQSFDIGANSSVKFDMASTGFSALNRITGSTTPSQIYGQLSATNGGEIYLINANGILFGKTAVVNTGSLIASGLDITDDNYKSSLLNSITAADPFAAVAFEYGGTAADFVDDKNFVQVDSGAQITSASGGRVFLFAKRVDNAGQISTPDGQTALAAGSQVYLELPTSRLYASESNPDVPALRGLLVEVGDKFEGASGTTADTHSGTVTNQVSGQISTPRGNATLVGLAVNQLGRVSATTSVSENGTIFLRAQGNATGVSNGTSVVVSPTTGGALVLGPGSTTEILPDTTLVAGVVPTSTDTATFTTSRIDLKGKTIDLQAGAGVVAPGGIVNVRAEAAPPQTLFDTTMSDPVITVDNDARIVLEDGARIDVSGTTGTTASVDRFFVTTDLLTSSDLKDAPLQKDGLLYRAQVTLDVRAASLILGDLSNYRDNLQRSVEERLAVGGTVNMAAEGGVLLAKGSSIDVSGGQVRYTDAMVRETLLLSTTGTLFTLNDAPIDQVYQLAVNLDKTSLTQYDRWGVLANTGSTTPARLELGYVEGQAGGTLKIAAPKVLMQGELAGRTVTGARQAAGLAPLAGASRLFIGNADAMGSFDNAKTTGGLAARPLLTDFAITAGGPLAADSVWADPLHATLSDWSGVALSTLASAGFGQLTVSGEGNVSLDAGAGWTLADRAAVTLQSSGGNVDFSGALTAHAGSVNLLSTFGSVLVADGAQADLSGRWINQLLDGQRDLSGLAGGSFSAQGQDGVVLGRGSLVDVSGGATVGATGSIAGANAGSITLKAGRTDLDALRAPDPETHTLSLGGTLRGAALQSSAGGSLALRTSSVRIGSAAGDAPAALTLMPDFFGTGGFSSYSVDGLLFNDVASGTVLAPSRQSWFQSTMMAVFAPTGSTVSSVLGYGQAPLTLAPTVNLALASSGIASATLDANLIATSYVGGKLDIASGASVTLVPGSAFGGAAANQVLMDGKITDHGGSVALNVAGQTQADVPNVLWLGAGSVIDVSGAVLSTPSNDGLRRGTVQDGGTITLNASGGAAHNATSLVLQDGATLSLDGNAAVLDILQLGVSGPATTRQVVASHGGTLNITGTSDLILEGRVSARGGSPAAAGGAINISLLGARDDFVNGADAATWAVLPPLTLAQAATHESATLTPDSLPSAIALGQRNASGTSNATVSADWVAASGAADLTLSAPQTLHIAPGVNLGLSRNLVVEAAALQVDAGAHASLQAGTVVLQNTRLLADPNSKQGTRPAPVAAEGTGALAVRAHDVIVDGHIVTQGVGTLSLSATADLRLQSSASANANAGSLTVDGNLNLSAGQLYPATGQSFTLDATGHAVHIQGGNPALAKPLSAGGSLVIDADVIEQDGVLRAPFGSIALNAATRLTLGAGSETSVSAEGLTVSYGATGNGGTTWNGSVTSGVAPVLTSLPGKTLSLTAPAITTAAGASVDLSGGGTVVGYEFVTGPGGSSDVFLGGNGAYAIVPTVQGLAPYDPSFAGAATFGRQLVFGAGGPIPAGTYTLLPARYALLPGAFLVKPGTGTPLAFGTAIANADGSVLVGARSADLDTRFSSSLSSTWRVQTRDQALKSSEIRITDAATYFAALAQKNDVAAPRGAADGGVLQVAAANASLAGSFRFHGAIDGTGQAIGLGGVADFSATHIVVGNDDTPVQAGVLTLSARQLNDMAPDTLLLGATVGASSASGTALDVVAQDVKFVNTATALDVGDLIATATGSVNVAGGVAIVARTPESGAAAPAHFTINESGAGDGDGAALRLSNQTGAALTRTASTRHAGTLTIGAGARLDAGAGTLVLDSTLSSALAGTAVLTAADTTLAAGAINVGNAAATNSLVLDDVLLAQVNNSTALTLRGYDNIAFQDNAVVGGSALQSLTLDTGRLQTANADASVAAGEIRLQNTTGVASPAGTAGGGTLTLHADSATGSGRIVLDRGTVAVNGATALTLQADHALVLAGASALSVAGDMTISAPEIIAAHPTGTAGLVPTVADTTLTASGTLAFQGSGARDATASAVGAALTVNAARITQATAIDLPSGQVSFNATNGAMAFAAGSTTNVAGVVRQIDGADVGTGGGRVLVTAVGGDLTVASGAGIDVSAAGTQSGGVASFTAAQGTVTLAGTLRGTAADPALGARLVIDGLATPTLDRIAAIQAEAPTNFDGTLDLRQRGPGTMTLDTGRTLAARTVRLSNDQGALRINGRVDAGGVDAGTITLAARDDVALGAGGTLSVHATGATSAGGVIDLSSTQGSLTFDASSTLDLRTDGSATHTDLNDGRLTLRARRLGVSDASPGGTGVAVGTLYGTVLGAEAIDVQAVKVYDDIDRITSDLTDTLPGALQQDTLNTDGLAFAGVDGTRADALATRIAGSHADLLDKLRIHAEAEVRARGDLTISTPKSLDYSVSDDFVLPTESVANPDSLHVGDTSLTLRAAGDITIARTISAGFDPVYYAGFYTDTRQAPRTVGAHAGNIRIAAGADLAAASSLATAAGAGSLTIARSDQRRVGYNDAANLVAVRSTTGNVQLAAGRDIDMSANGALVYTTGLDVSDQMTDALRLAFPYTNSATYAFTRAAGDVNLDARGSILGNDSVYFQRVYRPTELSDYRPLIQTLYTSLDDIPVQADVWNLTTLNPQQLYGVQHGVFSLGGGRVGVRAGGDIANVTALSPSSGYVLRDDTGAATQTRVFSGGNVSVEAGRDVVNGLFESGGTRVDVAAGRDVALRPLHIHDLVETGPRVLTEDAAATVRARRDLTLGSIEAAFYTQDQGLSGLDGDAQANIQAAGGNVNVLLNPEGALVGQGSLVLPARFIATAPWGDLAMGTTDTSTSAAQIPTRGSAFELLSGGDLTLGGEGSSLDLRASADLANGPVLSDISGGLPVEIPDRSDRTPAHIASADGDLTLHHITSTRPMRVASGHDLTLIAPVVIEHLATATGADGLPVSVDEMSSLVAGRDVLFRGPPGSPALLEVSGPGELLVLAGRNVDFGTGTGQTELPSGILASGNTRDASLPARAVDVTVIAGLRTDGSDYQQAARLGFELLGANALTDRAGDLYALLSATGSAVVPLGSSAASAFDGAALATQLAKVQALLGANAYDTALASYVRSLPGQSGLSDAQALALFPTLSSVKQSAAPGVMLAGSFADQPQARRDAFVVEVAAARDPATQAAAQAALIGYMAAIDGQTRSLPDALAAFEALPLERQIPLTDQVLVAEVKANGRIAAGTFGSAQEDAYARGYRTIASVFPMDRPAGEIDMPKAVVKTLQQGDITLMTPGGGVNGGGIGALDISPNNLGVVTVAGGDISAITRDDFLVNQSRVFTLAKGDITMWSSAGNIDAGRGAKTVVGAPAPVLRIDASGHLFLDTSGSFSGSGIAVLDANSTLDLYAPAGAIDAGEAGIKSAGNAYFGASVFRGTDNLSVGGSSTGAPPPVSSVGATAGLASAGNQLNNTANALGDDDNDKRRKRRSKRALLLEFLGFGTSAN